jgi:hypothetical protein
MRTGNGLGRFPSLGQACSRLPGSMASAMRGSATLCAERPAIACGYTTICETSVLVDRHRKRISIGFVDCPHRRRSSGSVGAGIGFYQIDDLGFSAMGQRLIPSKVIHLRTKKRADCSAPSLTAARNVAGGTVVAARQIPGSGREATVLASYRGWRT